jgi:AcrR family transcriptional regulator
MVSKIDKEALVLKSAEAVFTRYGFARTTMGDIAAEAGISRPALYLLFADKEALFARVIEMMDRRSLADIAARIKDIGSVDEKLRSACLAWGLHGVELAAAHPDAADLFDLRFPPVRQAYMNFQTMLAGILGDAVSDAGLSISAQEFAQSIVFGMRGLRHAATGVDDMKALIGVQADIYAAALRAEPVVTKSSSDQAE